jgi:hypothetical protein
MTFKSTAYMIFPGNSVEQNKLAVAFERLHVCRI